MSSDAEFDLKKFWDLVCEAGLDRKRIGEMNREEVERLLRAAYFCVLRDLVPF